jgi:hypothetical protein
VSLFDWLLVGHLIGDFLMQTDSMASRKENSWSWMLGHVGIYMVVIGAVLIVYALSHSLPAWLLAVVLLFICGTHIVLDRRGFALWWMRFVNIAPDHEWLPIVVDQVFHLLTLAVVAQVLVLVGG